MAGDLKVEPTPTSVDPGPGYVEIERIAKSASIRITRSNRRMGQNSRRGQDRRRHHHFGDRQVCFRGVMNSQLLTEFASPVNGAHNPAIQLCV